MKYILTIFIAFSLVFSVRSQQNSQKVVSVIPAMRYQTIDGFGDCSMWDKLESTYSFFNTTNPAKLDEIADMMFTNKDPDRSFNFRFNHQVDILGVINTTTNAYVSKSQKDATNRYWYAQKLIERGGEVSFRQSMLPSLYSEVVNSKGTKVSQNTDVPLFMSIMASTIKKFQNDYGITITSYTPMNESASPWTPATGRPIGANSHLTDAQTVTFIKEARKAFDAEGLADVKLAAFDALYLNNYPRLNNMLNSDAVGLLDHLSFHQYQVNETFQEVWYEKAKVHNLKLRQTEWGDWTNLSADKEHVQALNYATQIFKSLSRGKVSVWLAWELKFIFDMSKEGWEPKEAAWMIAQYSRFADPGMQMLGVNDMGAQSGTLAFMQPGTGERDMSYITYNDSKDPIEYVYDFNTLANVSLKDVRQTNDVDNFKKLDCTIDSRNRLYITVPGESMLSIRVGFNGLNDSGKAIDKADWNVVSVTSEETNRDNNAAKNVFDGDLNTFWHTKWNASVPFPHDLVLDLGDEYLINSFSYLPRQGQSTNGTIGDYDLYISNDGVNWGEAVSSGAFSKDQDLKRAFFYPQYGRFVKFVSKSSAYGDNYSSCAELDIFKVDQPIESPTAKFELSETEVFTGQSITFRDFSTEYPTNRMWYIEKGQKIDTVYSEVFSTQYFEAGRFDVTLVVWNKEGKDSLTSESYVTVKADVKAPGLPSDLSCIYGHNHASLSWKAALDDISDQVFYNIYLDGVFVEQVFSLIYAYSGLNDNQSYQLGITSVDLTGNESSLVSYDIITSPYVEDQWVEVPVINNSFELPDNGKKILLTSELPGWNDDFEAYDAIGRTPYSASPEGSMVAYLASHSGGSMYQALPEVIAEKSTRYRLTFIARASYFSDKSSVGKIKSTLACYGLTEDATQRLEVASVETDILASHTTFVEHQVLFDVANNSVFKDNFAVIEFDITNLSGFNWMHLDDIKLEKKISSSTGVDIAKYPEVTISPNPVSGAYITIDGLTEQAQIEVYLISGRKVMTTNLDNKRLDVHGLESGAYILKIRDNDKLIVRRLMVSQ